MAKEIAAGFDIAALISEATISRIFQVSYHAGLLPVHASTQFSHLTGDHQLELSFLPPSLQFVSLPNVHNGVKLRFPFLAQVPTMNAQGAGAVTVFLTATKEQAFNAANEEVDLVVLDFSTVPASQFQFEPEPLPSLPPSSVHAFSALDPGIVQDVAAPLAKDTLVAGISQIPLTPRVSSSFGFFTFRTYVSPDFVLPPDGTPYVLPRVLGAYVNLASETREPPLQPPLDLHQPVKWWDGHVDSLLWSDPDQIKAAVPSTLVHAHLNEALAEQGLGSLPAPLPDDATVVINELDIDLADGHLLVTGSATQDATIDFTLKIVLSMDNGTLHAVVIDKDFDLPWWLDALTVLVPLIFAAVGHAIALTIAKELSSVGDFSGGLLSDVNVFSGGLPGVEGLSQLQVVNDGDVEISTQGLVLPGRIETHFGESAIEQPFYVYGHLHSREFHRKGQGCPFLEKMKPKNTILFLSPAAALAQGYNGCRFCYLDYDAAPAGRIILHFRDLETPVPTEGIPFSLRFAMLQAVTLGDQEIKPQFEIQRSYDGHIEDDGILYFDDLGLPDFLPGTWRLDVESDNWSTTCELVVKKWAKLNGKNTVVTFTIGVAGCGTAFGAMPEYPEP